VDDQPELVSAVAGVLQAEGYDVVGATSGQEAMALIQRLRPDLVVLDVVLDDADGLELCRQIKADPALAGVYVLLISGVATRLGHRVAGLNGGADGYLVKPFHLQELLARVSALVRVQQVQKALQEAEERWHSLVEHAPEIVATVDAEGRIEFVNRAPSGFALERLIGSSVFEYCAPSAHAHVRQLLEQVFERGEGASFEVPGVGADGRTVWLAGRAGPIRQSGRIESAVILASDVTARRETEETLRRVRDELEEGVRARTAELARANDSLRREVQQHVQAVEALRESEARFRCLSEWSPLGIYRTDAEGRLEYINRRGEDICGFRLEEGKGAGWVDFVHPEERELVVAEWVSIVRNQAAFAREFRCQQRDGTVRWLSVQGAPVLAEGHLVGYVGTVADVTERRHEEAALRELPGRTVSAQESERCRVAGELEARVTQVLSSAKLQLDSAEPELVGQSPAVRQAVIRARELLERALQEVLRISESLRPRELDELGLAASVRRLVGQFQELAGVSVEAHIGRLPRELPSEGALCLYRLVQEALCSAARQAQATKVKLHLARRDAFIELRIHDDGTGFLSPPTDRASTRGGGTLAAMRDRTVLAGGTFHLESVPAKGTEITVRLPALGAGTG
jgi:PAS domain S-box-containing protein